MSDPFEDFFREIILKAAFGMVEKRWPEALDGNAMAWVKANRSELYIEAEERIYPEVNELYGKDIEKFRTLVIRYGKALVKCFEVYAEHLKDNPPQSFFGKGGGEEGEIAASPAAPRNDRERDFPRPEPARAQERLL